MSYLLYHLKDFFWIVLWSFVFAAFIPMHRNDSGVEGYSTKVVILIFMFLLMKCTG